MRNKHVAIAIFALMIPSQVIAQQSPCEWPPPSHFDHAPTKPYTFKKLLNPKLTNTCNAIFAEGGWAGFPLVYGCTDIKRRVVYILKGGAGCMTETNIWRHEVGHLNGWLHD